MENHEKKQNPGNTITADLSVSFKKFYDIIAILRGPHGCPWDKKQTAHSLRKSVIEEAYECISAIDESYNEHS